MCDDKSSQQDSQYRGHLAWVAANKQRKQNDDNGRSMRHFDEQQSNRYSRVVKADKLRLTENKRINSAMHTFTDKLQQHNQRASSARSERIESLTQKHMGWEKKLTGLKSKEEADNLSKF